MAVDRRAWAGVWQRVNHRLTSSKRVLASVARWSSCWRSGARRVLFPCDHRRLFRHRSTDGRRLVQLQIHPGCFLPNPPEHSTSFAKSLPSIAPPSASSTLLPLQPEPFSSPAPAEAPPRVPHRGQHHSDSLRCRSLLGCSRGELLKLLRRSARALLAWGGRRLLGRGSYPPCPWSRRLG